MKARLYARPCPPTAFDEFGSTPGPVLVAAGMFGALGWSGDDPGTTYALAYLALLFFWMGRAQGLGASPEYEEIHGDG